MALLFADTTYDIHLGLLSDDLRWMEFRSQSGQKASAVLQSEIHDLCRVHGVDPRRLEGVVTCAGPGFYTGLRLSEGFADICKFFGVKTYSFYSYEVPLWCGYTSGTWVTKAYRGEYFLHQWSEAGSENKLVTVQELPSVLTGLEHVFLHSNGAMDKELPARTLTLDLLENSPEAIFSKALKAGTKESYYFRAPEDEFRVSV